MPDTQHLQERIRELESENTQLRRHAAWAAMRARAAAENAINAMGELEARLVDEDGAVAQAG